MSEVLVVFYSCLDGHGENGVIYGLVMSDGMPLVNNCEFCGIQDGCVCRVDG